jgi:hypothetical protein
MRWDNQVSSMGWITIPLLLAALAWTALSFLAYSDWVLVFKSSLPVWLVWAAVCGLTRIVSARAPKPRAASEKANTAHRHRLPVTGAAVAVSLAILILTVWSVKWLERRNNSGRNVVSVARNSTSAGKESERLPKAEKPKKNRSTETTPRAKKERWSVQVGAFRSEQDAVKVAKSLKGKGYKAYVMRGEDNANVYRAKVGRFATREEAERLLRVLKDKEALRSAFVARL